eukprot:SAG31_NODE_733_length_12491_cov_7.073112_3_plen_56_part_00
MPTTDAIAALAVQRNAGTCADRGVELNGLVELPVRGASNDDSSTVRSRMVMVVSS